MCIESLTAPSQPTPLSRSSLDTYNRSRQASAASVCQGLPDFSGQIEGHLLGKRFPQAGEGLLIIAAPFG